ncbi:IclR family transcriptional regulator [Aquabacter cavernae]|uniref:IclR family transcriptional regulator n=1 Tax=Aquabacter cavernae TaxID=2496029 RepID=UPI000F8F2B89|nr:IclR family transcriptional regulator [Aquabacter cavernae]
MDHGRGNGAGDEAAAGGTRSIERAIALLLLVGRAGAAGARLSDLVATSSLPKPTVRRVLLALVRSGLLDQDGQTRRYHIGPEAYVLGTLASARFGIHALSLDGLARLARESGDCAFLSVPRDDFAVCIHREEGPFPIRTHVLQAGDRHPLGIGAGSLALLSALPDDEAEAVLARNAALVAADYPAYPPEVLRALVAQTRARGYAVNPGLVVAGSWGVGVAVPGPDGRPVGALSIAAIESRLTEDRQRLVAPLLMREADRLAAALAGASHTSQKPAPRAVAKARS